MVPAVLPATATADRPPALHALYRARVSTGSVRRFAERARRRRWLTWRPVAVAGAVLRCSSWSAGWCGLAPARRPRGAAGRGRARHAGGGGGVVTPELGDRCRAWTPTPCASGSSGCPRWPRPGASGVAGHDRGAGDGAGAGGAVPAGRVRPGRRRGRAARGRAEARAGLPLVSAETVAAGDDRCSAATGCWRRSRPSSARGGWHQRRHPRLGRPDPAAGAQWCGGARTTPSARARAAGPARHPRRRLRRLGPQHPRHPLTPPDPRSAGTPAHLHAKFDRSRGMPAPS